MRTYNKWGGNPKGTEEDPKRCVVSVPEKGRSCLSYQCRNKRGKGYNGLFCGIHAKKFGKEDIDKGFWIPEDK
jgi:hypothetical protein